MTVTYQWARAKDSIEQGPFSIYSVLKGLILSRKHENIVRDYVGILILPYERQW